LAVSNALILGKPVVALKTGGMTSQIIDKRNGNVHGVALEPVERYLVGSQATPYIYDDHFSKKELAEGLYKIFKLSPEEKEKISLEAKDHVEHEFSYKNMISEWDRTLEALISKWRSGKGEKNWGGIHYGIPADKNVLRLENETKTRSPKVKG
jgi:glycosyltransferase involved in cell wall biosynthesis